MPQPNVNLLAKEVLKATLSEIKTTFTDEGYSDVDRRVWSGSVPDTALDPWVVLEIVDNLHSDMEDKETPMEVVFIGASFYATEDGATNPYIAALDLAKQATKKMTMETFSVSGQDVYANRHSLTEPASQAGPEQVDLFGFTVQFEIHLE